MGHLDHATFGWLTPVLSYVMACIGAALGLRCTVRALATTGAKRARKLVTKLKPRIAPVPQGASALQRTAT